MKVMALKPEHEEALEELLLLDPVLNLFLLAWAQERGVRDFAGVFQGGELLGTCMISRKLVVPFCPDPEHASVLGRCIRMDPTWVAGPREASDALWATWQPQTDPVRRDQDLMVCDTDPGPDLRVRRATKDDLPFLLANQGRMEREDIGRSATEEEREKAVLSRVESSRQWIGLRDGEPVFQVAEGVSGPWGVQIGGTAVPPEFRRQGIATAGMRGVCHVLLRSMKRVTLHVHESNTAAIRAYKSCGFSSYAPFRLIAPRDQVLT